MEALRPGALYLQERPERGDRFGSALTLNDFTRSGDDDLAVGAPGETVGGARGAGAVTIVHGHQFFENERLLYQGHGGIGGTPEAGDAFGAAVA